ncbi:MAG: hypothetical protein M1268_01995 [Patescibacteria group bacterium]|nr:hypothetical protein [Patescibacteria group bacterium]
MADIRNSISDKYRKLFLMGGDSMGGFGGFYKGEKKKQKKNKEIKNISFNTYTVKLPEIVSKKKPA